MTSQPLETIPESTPTPAPAPAKRLAEYRLAREALKKAEAEAAKPAASASDVTVDNSSSLSLKAMLKIGSLIFLLWTCIDEV